MKFLTSLFFTTALATAAFADPAYYRVTGVAANDTLNIREAPDAKSADIGDLAHDARAIEVLETDPTGKWGRLLWWENSGWVSMRFLEPDDLEMIADTSLPVGLSCGGTEPFWSLTLGATSATYSDPSGMNAEMPMVSSASASGRPNWPLVLRHAGLDSSILSVVRAQTCGDGMSDRDYGYALTTILTIGLEERVLEGCCAFPLANE